MNKFIKLTVNIDMIIKNVERLEWNTKIVSYYYANVSFAIGIIINVWWTLKINIFGNIYKFISINLFLLRQGI